MNKNNKNLSLQKLISRVVGFAVIFVIGWIAFNFATGRIFSKINKPYNGKGDLCKEVSVSLNESKDIVLKEGEQSRILTTNSYKSRPADFDNGFTYEDPVLAHDCRYVMALRKYNFTTGGGFKHKVIIFDRLQDKFIDPTIGIDQELGINRSTAIRESHLSSYDGFFDVSNNKKFVIIVLQPEQVAGKLFYFLRDGTLKELNISKGFIEKGLTMDITGLDDIAIFKIRVLDNGNVIIPFVKDDKTDNLYIYRINIGGSATLISKTPRPDLSKWTDDNTLTLGFDCEVGSKDFDKCKSVKKIEGLK